MAAVVTRLPSPEGEHEPVITLVDAATGHVIGRTTGDMWASGDVRAPGSCWSTSAPTAPMAAPSWGEPCPDVFAVDTRTGHEVGPAFVRPGHGHVYVLCGRWHRLVRGDGRRGPGHGVRRRFRGTHGHVRPGHHQPPVPRPHARRDDHGQPHRRRPHRDRVPPWPAHAGVVDRAAGAGFAGLSDVVVLLGGLRSRAVCDGRRPDGATGPGDRPDAVRVPTGIAGRSPSAATSLSATTRTRDPVRSTRCSCWTCATGAHRHHARPRRGVEWSGRRGRALLSAGRARTAPRSSCSTATA